MTWPAISSAASAVITPNTPRAIDSGLIARSAWAREDGSDMDVVRSVRRKRSFDLTFHDGHVACAAVELVPVQHPERAALDDRPGERGGEDQVSLTVGIDVVLHDFVVELHAPDHRDGETFDRLHPCVCRSRASRFAGR